jgi:hypothetical protein
MTPPAKPPPVKEIAVALSGTLETFSLPDVLRLLSSTKKTGLLALDGDRGRGHIWVRDGAIVEADADRAGHEQIDGVAFELLRFVEGSFVFDSGAESPAEAEAHEVDDVLAVAETRLAEWREIEAVVPSLDVRVRMVPELAAERRLTPAQWRMLAQVGTGVTGHVLSDRLGEGEYDVCRQLRDLMDDGMVELDEAPSAFDTMVDTGSGVEVPAELDDAAPEVTFEPVPDQGDDHLSQLSHLSPKAAAAIEATWTDDDETDAETDATPPETAVEDVPSAPAADNATPAGDDMDQNLLLRFLSSAKS